MDSKIPSLSFMLMSKEKGRYTVCNARKVIAGQFLTKKNIWLQPQILEFIASRKPAVVLDPFAGEGDLLHAVQEILDCRVQGLDILGSAWPRNDSLRSIPPLRDGMIVTNPPYLASHSAKRKGVFKQVESYYKESGRHDLYLIALDRCLEACSQVLAIVPETLLNSGYSLRHAVHVTVLHDNPFADTETPVCVACFDRSQEYDTMIYLDNRKAITLSRLESLRLKPENTENILFNVPHGRIGLRAVDMPSSDKPMAFMPRSQLGYDVAGIKVSSRLVTFVEIPHLNDAAVPELCTRANAILLEHRAATSGLCLSPFKGNTKLGQRRRRLDYASARAILETTLAQMQLGQNNLYPQQQLLFA